MKANLKKFGMVLFGVVMSLVVIGFAARFLPAGVLAKIPGLRSIQ